MKTYKYEFKAQSFAVGISLQSAVFSLHFFGPWACRRGD